MRLAYTFEAEDSADKATKRADAAAREILQDRDQLERETIQKLLKQLETTKRALSSRLLSGTAYKRFTTQALIADVNRMMGDAQRRLAKLAESAIEEAASLGDAFAEEPVAAAYLPVNKAIVGLDEHVIQATFRNTAHLLTQPMQQFGLDVQVSLRRLTLAGENRADEIARLRAKIEGAGIEGAYFKAERIIRTETGRTFNDATDSRLVRISDALPPGVIGKGWRATPGSRTRRGHREAGETYARGKGIPIASMFKINVYDEWPNKPVKFIGVATLRFPIDPNTTPAGRIAQAATILCRCNNFVDINASRYAEYMRSRVSLALPAGPPPAPVPRPAIPRSTTPTKAAPVPKSARVRTPSVKTPTPADVTLSTEPIAKQADRVVKKTQAGAGVIGLANRLRARGYQVELKPLGTNVMSKYRGPGTRELIATKTRGQSKVTVTARGTSTRLFKLGGQGAIAIDYQNPGIQKTYTTPGGELRSYARALSKGSVNAGRLRKPKKR